MIEDDNENKKPLISNNYNEENDLIDKDNLSDIDENENNNNKKISNENLYEIKNISDLEEPILNSKDELFPFIFPKCLLVNLTFFANKIFLKAQ